MLPTNYISPKVQLIYIKLASKGNKKSALHSLVLLEVSRDLNIRDYYDRLLIEPLHLMLNKTADS